ncbi:MAG: hypothetical protein R3A52_29945 [Polyangiales bacterium]
MLEPEADPTSTATSTLRAARAGWSLGRLRYRQHRFAEAAALHDVAAAEERLALRIEAQNAASAAMEAFDDVGAAEAARACALGGAVPPPVFEARAEWILRLPAYRNGCRARSTRFSRRCGTWGWSTSALMGPPHRGRGGVAAATSRGRGSSRCTRGGRGATAGRAARCWCALALACGEPWSRARSTRCSIGRGPATRRASRCR